MRHSGCVWELRVIWATVTLLFAQWVVKHIARVLGADTLAVSARNDIGRIDLIYPGQPLTTTYYPKEYGHLFQYEENRNV